MLSLYLIFKHIGMDTVTLNTSFRFIANLNILTQTNGSPVLRFSVFWSRKFNGKAVAADSTESYLK